MSTIFLDNLNEDDNDAPDNPDSSTVSSDDGSAPADADVTGAPEEGGPSWDGASFGPRGNPYSFDPHLDAFAGQAATISGGSLSDSDDGDDPAVRTMGGNFSRPTGGTAETDADGGGSDGSDSGSEGGDSGDDTPNDGNAGRTVAQDGTAATPKAPSQTPKANNGSDPAREKVRGQLAAYFQKSMPPDFWDRFQTALAMDHSQLGGAFTKPLLAQIAAAPSPPKASILLYNSKAPGKGDQTQANGTSFAKVAANWNGGGVPIDISEPDWKARYQSILGQYPEGTRFDVMILDHGVPGAFSFGNLPNGQPNYINSSNAVNNPILNQLFNGNLKGKIDKLWLLTCNTGGSEAPTGPTIVKGLTSALPYLISDTYGVNVAASKGEWRMDFPADPRDANAYPAPGFSVRLPWTESYGTGGAGETRNRKPQPWR